MRNRSRGIFLTVLFVIGSMGAIFAQSSIEKARVPRSFLQKKVPRAAHGKDLITAAMIRSKRAAGISTSAAVAAAVPGVDSVVNWSDQFTTSGFDSNGNPQSVWPYTMVGMAPESGRAVTIRAPIVPVTLDLLGPDGNVAIYHGVPLTFRPSRDMISGLTKSPIYQPFIYTSGVGQFNDQMMRAQFWDRIQHGGNGNGWHINLAPDAKRGRRMQIPLRG